MDLEPVKELINTVFSIYIGILFASVIASWLVAFRILNTQNQFIYTVLGFLYRVTEPVLRQIRRVIPPIGGFDLSPMILIILLIFVRELIVSNIR